MSVLSTCGGYWLTGYSLLILSICQSAAAGASWTYTGDHGQEHWEASYPDCGGTAQSPININTSNVSYDELLPAIEPKGYSMPGASPFTLTNNGHTVVLSLPSSMRIRGLSYNFTAVQLHLHWGNMSLREGSEHQIDGKVYPAELHIVHYNADKFSTIGDAKNKPNGLAVLGILIEIGTMENTGYSNILNYLDEVRYAGQTTQIPSFNVEQLLPERLDKYFRYSGSLTTPPCYQSVRWTVFCNAAQISVSQMQKLSATLHASEANSPPGLLQNNFRDPQPLNLRTVYSSFQIKPALPLGQILGIVFGTLGGVLCISLILLFTIKKMRSH
ncbi:carbonic anhydrase 14 isoform X2 [Pseudophryne corroboree]|uniref:carbonic anhydrase 14 isoform X2 n=1 Tax=Pseudophryne corroboree TaxID=495146 RepID=UPI003081738E